MSIRLKLILAFTALSLSVSALEITNTAGGLGAAIGENTAITSLSVSGEMDASDFEFIGSELSELTTLDLSNAIIVAYSGNAIITGRTEYAANALPAYSLMGSKISSIILPSTLVEIGDAALSSTQLTTITIPGTVKTIGSGAFSNCDELATVEIPASVTKLAPYAFMECDKLTTVKMGKGISSIEESTFARCYSLSNVTLPSSLTTIDNGAFNNCKAIKSVTFPTTITAIGDYAFQYTGLTSVNLGGNNKMATIGEWAFANCPDLTTVQLNDNISTIGKGAFFDDPSLFEFNMPASCKEVKEYVFKGTNTIDTTSVLHSDIERIGAYAMTGWNHVTTFTLPASLAYIGDNAFEGWENMLQLNAEHLSAVPELGDSVWHGVDQASVSLIVNAPYYTDFATAEQWKEFKITAGTLVEDVMQDKTAGNNVKAYFTGNIMTVKATTEIENLVIYDSSGRQQIHATPQADEVTVDTGGWSCRIYIVKVSLTDGTQTTLKLARR